MYKNLIQKIPIKLCAAVVCSAVVFKNFREAQPIEHHATGYNYSRRYYPASSEYPDLTKNRSIMARNLTQSLYAKLRDLRTPNGFNVDNAFQTGVDNIGSFSYTGIVAGDEETYEVLKELFSKVIFEKHNFDMNTQKHKTDLDPRKLKDANFDPNYVQSVRIRTLRNIRGFCLPPFCTRGERRDIESIVVKSLYKLDTEYQGTYYALKDLSTEEETTLMNHNLNMERPYLPTETSAGLSRDWPDARGIWFNNDKSIATYVNGKDHMKIAVVEKSGDFQKSFEKFCEFIRHVEFSIKAEKWLVMYHSNLGYLTTDPSDLGTALKLSARIKLPKLSQDGRLTAILKKLNMNNKYRTIEEESKTNESAEGNGNKGLLEISSIQTLGRSEVEIAQSFADAINTLISIEKKLENGGSLDDELYK